MKKILSLFTALILFGSMTVQADYYVAGTMNGWNAGSNDWKMSGSNPSSFTKQMASGTYQFKVTNGSWAWSTASFDNSLSNVTLSSKDGNIQFTLSEESNVTFYYNESNVYVQAVEVVVPSYTFPAGTTIYYDFTAYSTTGINTYVGGSEAWYGSTSNVIAITLTDDWKVTASTKLWRSGASGWNDYYCTTLPTAGQDMIISTDGINYVWSTYGGGVLPPASIKLHSNITNPSWADTEEFDLASNEETASLTLTGVTKGDYEFGVKIADSWTSNGSAFTRDNNSHEIVAGSGNCTFNADRNGDYTFTWTYATNTLSVTYPAVPAQSVELTGLSAQILRGTEVAFAATSSGIDEPGYRFYVKEKNGSYGSAVASYPFDVVGEYVVKVEALEYNTGDPVAEDESGIIVVYDEHTFNSGATIYVDFSAMTEGTKGVNYPKVDQVGVDYDAAGAGTLKTITFSADVTWTTMADAFIKTEKAGWAALKFSVPGDGQNCAVVAADGASYTWTTLVPPPPTIKLHGDFTGSWGNTDAFVIAGNEETASLSLTIPAKGTKSFGVRIGSDDNWTSNGAAITRANASAVITSGEGNCSLNADIPGEYIFTWTYASNTLSVTYPELPSQFVEFDGLASQILKGTEVTFAANSSGITNPVYSYFVKPEGGEYGSAVAAYTFNAEGNFVVKVSAEGDNTAAPVVAEENVSVYDAHTFTSGTTIFVDFSAVSGDAKGVNYPNVGGKWLDYDGEGAGNIKTVTFSADVTWTTNDVFIKTEKAGWDPGMKFTVPGDGQNCAVVAADGASFTWSTHTAPVVTVEAKGEWDNWTDALAFVPDVSGLTATATLADLPAGNYNFKIILDGTDWRSNGHTYHRDYTGASGITGNSDDMVLQADADGEYTITWTFATNALDITFPEAPAVVGDATLRFMSPRTESGEWERVYAYAWLPKSPDVEVLSDPWPGTEITGSKSGEWYSYTVQKGASLIFSDGSKNQTYDITNIQADACYVPNRIDVPATPEEQTKVAFASQCTVEYYITGDEGIAGAGNAWNAAVPALKMDENNQIVFSSLPAGIYEFKITNGSWAWSLGGKEHLNNSCSNAAATTGSGNVKFKLEDEQDVTISYNPATQKICLDATTVLPYEDVRLGLTDGNYYTVCFNREMKQIRGASLWSFIGRDADFAYIVQESAPFAAGKPFIVFAESEKLEAVLDAEVSAPVANGALHGTFTNLGQADLDGKKAAAGDKDVYLVIGNELRRATGASTGDNSLPAYRAYVIVDEIAPISTPNPAPGKNVRSMPMHKDATQGFENIEASDKPMKLMIDGQLYILRGEKVYDATGRMVK